MTGVGEAIVDVMLNDPSLHASRLRSVRDWFVRMATPPIGVRLVAEDGGVFTGIVLIENNRPTLMLALRTGTSVGSERAPYERYMRPLDDELWSPRPDERFR